MFSGHKYLDWWRSDRLVWLLFVLLVFLRSTPIVAETTNRLIHESSPYLRLHAHNPVDWYPWGEEAIEKARAEDLPIFLSVGYSTCYWCHVMEREVFSDPAIAELMNRWFVNIKVDREERPELDEIYMTATQLLIRGAGGWPNSVFLTPNLEPFFAGTYFPPQDRRGRPGFPSVLKGLHDAWANRRAEVETVAHNVAGALRQFLAGEQQQTSQVATLDVASRTVEQLKKGFDERHGGFGTGRKFPSPSNLYLLWEVAKRGDDEARRMVLETLRQMGRGAIFDQLDGGFHRYTLDAAWRIPHFEKMLYDNAHLGELLALAASEIGDPELERLARGTFEWVLAEMTLANGAFKSAIDAETDTVEGAFYIWTREELEETLGEEGFELLGPIYGFDSEPNFEHDHYTLYLTAPFAEHARRLELSRETLLTRLEPYIDTLQRVRSQRKFPLVDDKVLTDWNGMMIAAMARGGNLLDEPRYITAAERAAEFVLTLRDGKGIQLHTWRNGVAKIHAFLDDYAFLIRGLLALHEATGSKKWLVEAERLSQQLETRLRDPSGGYFMSEAEPDLLIRVKSAGDGAIPSGNGIAILGLLRLAEITGNSSYRERAEAGIKSFGTQLSSHPGSLTTIALAVYRQQDGGAGAPREASVVVDAVQPPSRLHALAEEKVQSVVRLKGDAGDDGWRPIDVVVDIQDGWHVNANPASLEFLIPTQVRGDVRAVDYPPGESFRFAFADEVLSVYSGLTTIPGELAPDVDVVQLTYQACDDSRCLPPVTRTLDVSAE